MSRHNFHNEDKAKVYKTTQTNEDGRKVEKLKIETDNHDITIFGSKDNDSDKDKTINVEMGEVE